MDKAYNDALPVPVYWVQDLPVCVAERLWDWGYTVDTASIGQAVFASMEVIRLIQAKDDYYYLDYADTAYLQIMKEDAEKFLSKYRFYEGIGLE